MTKRLFDIFFSLAGLLVLSPLLVLIAILIKTNSKGDVLFKQERVGQYGNTFTIYKFRTMVENAEKKGKQITVGADKRITTVGKILRKTKLDELAQLINVLKGEMSFVGPRPEVPKYVKHYTEEQRKILNARPGITDYASIEFSNESEILGIANDPEKTYINEIMPYKIKLNNKYLESISVLHDIKLIFLTFMKILGLIETKTEINKFLDDKSSLEL
ncbi:sugar transferase [Natroniella sp. ANB-PHB2]|uniref:sugar transferase n=1 Tax=Natroniella sp. ANB-PHB2 TaxID=3384444 RepID=UPI0038D4D6EA